MSTLAEVQAAVPHLTARELLELEETVRRARKQKPMELPQPSLRDLEAVSVGAVLAPLGTRDEWYREMLEGRV